ncbi:hypothetical protein SEVIR_5G397000v4 [Setaria viridis]|uniref:Uncharacterized protein n=2 Tax=Setaria TaxID=4554 RepID=K3XPL3_SETIT|nr:uncharacterized protein LOC101785012 [Setaria italica]XP_034597295.1 uncharacterized protein LOC117858348 [Setaria viridis]RCV28265.1 hypothetical protein SETIT_5G391800v2 [Setaria italica]TKW17874.1 hypothetical protein SEVIR_5G397000v2 [Setaria viridis]
MGDAGGGGGFALAVAFTAALASLFFLLLGAVILRHCWWRRNGAVPASTRGGFVLFDVCFTEDRPRRAARPPPSMERSRRRVPREINGDGEAAAAAADEQEPDEWEIARWKKIFGGPTRCLSTIDEGTEKGSTTAATTPAFCTPPASPDRRRAEARALDMASVAAQVQAQHHGS